MSVQETNSSAPVRKYRFGLALSGGGFRASFFHIGVLARLAELNLLRRVEVISTVSGGSIIGALYYLYVRNLLQNTEDSKIERQDYVRLVEALQRQFLQGVQKNLRMRTFANPWKNWRMYSRKYSRSDRIAELYTKHFYAPVVEPELRPTVPFAQLKIQPYGAGADFHPFAGEKEGATSNERRQNKVPVLIINTTTLNTGHNFQFTASWMGEPPPQRGQERIDKNTRLRRAYYHELPDKYQDLPLSVAVAASASVPGLFPPLALTDLFETMTPQLVDGGVHDNQGIKGLLDSHCTHLIVSDASGQMGDEAEPGVRAWASLKRSSDITMDRVREEEYQGLNWQKDVNEIRAFIFLHLKEELQQPELTWIGGQKKAEQKVDRKTNYGVDREVQRQLSNVRTDLDSFTDVEAYALMADGYLMAQRMIDEEVRRNFDPQSVDTPLAESPSWDFLRIKDYLSDPQQDPRFSEQLRVSSSLLFKAWQLLPLLKWSGVVVLAAFIVVSVRYFYAHANEPIPYLSDLAERGTTFGVLGAALLALALYGASFLLPSGLRGVLSFQRLPRRLVLGAGAAILGSLFVWVHLLIFERLFLWQGRVSRLQPK